jgi:hemolysin activation/secretion protein
VPVASLCVGLVVTGLPTVVYAQAPLGDPTGRSGDRPGLLQEEPRPAPPPGQILPPLLPPPPREFQLLPRVRAFVREIRVVGSTVFTADELAKVTAPYVNRELTAEDLEALRVALTLLYVNAGYVNSGAILPDQDVTEGVVTFQIIEGGLTDIEVEGNRWFRAGYLRRRFSLAAGPPLNINALQRRLQLLLEDPRIRRLNAELKPGLKPGEGVLNVRVEERIPFRLWLDLNNHQPPSVGAERGIIGVEHQNLTGNGDVLTLRYGRSEGLDPLLDFRYSLPLTAWDTTLSLQYRRNSFAVVEEPFTELDIESESDIYTLALRQPVYRTLNSEVALELIGERLSNETSLLGEPFTLSPGAHRGKSVVTAVRFAQEAVYRTQNQVIAGRSRFSVGVDALGATINTGDQPDGKFFAWLGQFQWVRRLGILDSQAILRSDLQVAADPLLALEQIALGGRFSVRGYRENTLLRDSAFLASLEIRVPVIRGQRWADFVELAPFADYGRGWNRKGPTPDPQDLSSVGIGLRWAATITWPVPIRPQLEVYWGHALRNIKTQGGDLQDKGLHLQFVITVF